VTPAETKPSRRRWAVAAGVTAALGLYGILAVTSLRQQSGTFDEVIHLPPGYVSLTWRDHRMNPDHPPLVRRLAALPLLLVDVRVDPDDHAWRVARPWEFGKRFLYRWNDACRLLFLGRLPIVFLGAVLAVAVFAWTRRHWGLPAAALALFLCVLSPDVLAHGQIVSTDLGITLFTFLTVIAFERLLEGVTARRLLLAGLSLGAALGTKFSGVGLLPILGLLGLTVALAPASLPVTFGVTTRQARTRARRLAVLAAALFAMGLIAIVVVWASYGFSSPLARDPAVNASFDWSRVQPENPVVRWAFQAARGRVLPEAWVWGFLHFLKHSESRPAFLLGQYSETGWWYYFPVTFAVKTPVALLVLLVLSFWLVVRRPGSLRVECALWLPVVVFLGLSMTRNINIGHRHLLPIYPFLFVAAGRCATLAWGSASGVARRALRPLAAAFLAGLGLWYALSVLSVHPHYLAYFNELAGGPRNGYRILVDSNLDWGQDLPGLAAWMEKNAVPRVKLLYFGTADPTYYGISCDRLPGYQPPPPSTLVRDVKPGDLVAISATHLQGLYLDPALLPLVARFRAMRPLATIGYSIFIYRADFAWPAS
jgi:hypothetical protein